MARLIDADALKKDLSENYTFYGFGQLMNDFYEALDSAPTIDAVSVVHGEWIDAGTDLDGTHYYRCSNCGWEVETDYPNCPYCTAKMKGADDE